MHRHVKSQNVLLASRADSLRLSLQMAEYQERVGRRIREARDAKGWSQAKLAHEIGPTKKGQPRDASTISRYERGKVMPGGELLEVIADKLDVTVASLMAKKPEPGTPDLLATLNGDDDLRGIILGMRAQLAQLSEQVGRLEQGRRPPADEESN